MRVVTPILRWLLIQNRKRNQRKQPPVPKPSPDEVLRAALGVLTGGPIDDLDLYRHALTHRSVLRGMQKTHLASNERLEFLGDSVLGFVTAEHLYKQFPDQDEGFLTRLRSKVVSGQACARYARNAGLGNLLLLSENMIHTGGRENTTILADAFEALIGAIYLDRGLDEARQFVLRTIEANADLEVLAERQDNHKSLLLEFAQAKGWAQPQYRIVTEEGPSHDKVFTVEVLVNGRPMGSGTAGSKKMAEQQAAAEALKKLRP